MRARTLALVLCMAGCAKSGTPGPSEPAAGGGAPSGGGPSGGGPSGGGGAALVAPTVPADLAIPEGNKLTFMAAARGVQIYECTADPVGALAWKLRAPRANLLDDSGAVVATHFGGIDKGLPAGPYWEAKDGSRVHGGKPASVPNPGSIALLRLEASDTAGTGVFAKVAFIHRLDTTGGAAPAGACEAGKQTEVPYTAKYYFYSKP
jgi:uncharacterized protein DUF3455